MGVISEQDLDGLIAEIGVGLKPGTVRAQTCTEIGALIAVWSQVAAWTNMLRREAAWPHRP